MMSPGSSFGSSSEQFPVGMRVLVVDDDVTCLKILEHMLQRCRYRGEFDRLVNLSFWRKCFVLCCSCYF